MPSYAKSLCFAVCLALSMAFAATVGPPAFASCPGTAGIVHNPDKGAFLIEELTARGTGPLLRFWAFGHYAQANSGVQPQFTEGKEWLVQMPDRRPPDEFILYQANWYGRDIVGCFLGTSDRTVVEMSYLINEGQTDHYGIYLIASVQWKGSMFNFSNVVNGNGRRPGDVKAIPVPPPAVSGTPTKGASGAFMNVSLSLPAAPSFGDEGAPELIKGYNVLYVNDTVPVSSYPGSYSPVLNPGSVRQPLGVVSPGTVEVAVPIPSKETYFVSQLVYNDPTAEIASSCTSSHTGPVRAINGSEESGEQSTEKLEAGTDDSGSSDDPVEEDSGQEEPQEGGQDVYESESNSGEGHEDTANNSSGEESGPQPSDRSGTSPASGASSPEPSRPVAPGTPSGPSRAGGFGLTTVSGGESSASERPIPSRPVVDRPNRRSERSFEQELQQRERARAGAHGSGPQSDAPSQPLSAGQGSRAAQPERGPSQPGDEPGSAEGTVARPVSDPAPTLIAKGPDRNDSDAAPFTGDVSAPAARMLKPEPPPAAHDGAEAKTTGLDRTMSRAPGSETGTSRPEQERKPGSTASGVAAPRKSSLWYLGDAFLILVLVTLGYLSYTGRNWA